MDCADFALHRAGLRLHAGAVRSDLASGSGRGTGFSRLWVSARAADLHRWPAFAWVGDIPDLLGRTTLDYFCGAALPEFASLSVRVDALA